MEKLPPRPPRPVRLQTLHLQAYSSTSQAGEDREGAHEQGVSSDEIQRRTEQPPHAVIEAIGVGEQDAQAQGEHAAAAHRQLKRTPISYLFSQAYGLWLFFSLFLITLLVTRSVSTQDYGVYASVQTAINTILYIVALGLEDALVTFVPRLSAERGKASSAHLVRLLLSFRVITLLVSVVIILFGLPALAALVSLIPGTGAASTAKGLRDPVLQAHTLPIALYVLGNSVANLLQSLCAAEMRMHRVFIVGGLVQLGLIAFGFFVLSRGWGIDGILWMQAIVALCGAVAFLAWFAPSLFVRGEGYRQPLRPVLQLGLSAWLTNLASGALLKQIALILLVVYAVSLSGIAYFNVAFQLADAANILLVAGFAGVGGSALATAFVGSNYSRLARTWQTLIKVETLLAAPGLVFCLFNASAVVTALYGNKYAAAGSLLAIFLLFNLITRVMGMTIHQYSLYVIGKQRLVLLSQWIGIALIIGVGIALVPPFGAAGALIADGVARAATGLLMFAFLRKHFPRNYLQELLSFTVRYLFALLIAALPAIFWHPASLLLLAVSGVIFVLLCIALLTFIRPLTQADLDMVRAMRPQFARYLGRFVRK